MGKIKILIADDNSGIRLDIRLFLSDQHDYEVIGEANTGLEAVRLASEFHPDIILMDIVMPQMSGLESSQVILQKYPETKIILLTYFYDEDYVAEFFSKGIRGCFIKESPYNELLKAIYSVLCNGEYFNPPNPLLIEERRISSKTK